MPCSPKVSGVRQIILPAPVKSVFLHVTCTQSDLQISPILAMLHTMIEARQKAPKGAEPVNGPRRVVVCWAVRHKAELTILDEDILTAAKCDHHSFLTLLSKHI